MTVMVASNGFHTDLYLPVTLFPVDHTFRADYPEAVWFAIGWGDEEFYRGNTSAADALNAIIPPGPTVLHVVALPSHPANWFSGEQVSIALSRAGALHLAEDAGSYLARDAAGEAIRLSDGNYAGASTFYRARGNYHAFHTCNQWLAARLRRSGAPINAPISIPAQAVTAQLKTFASRSCATLD